MKTKIAKNWRISLAFILLTIFVNWQIINAATQEYDTRYGRDNYGNVTDAIVAYHSDINDIFNSYIETLVSVPEADISYPLNGKCDGIDNVSTYCLAEELVPLLIEYLDGLSDHGQYVTDASSSATNIGDVSEIAKTRSLMIQMEKENAVEILDFALEIYNEFQIMYPIHKEYKVLIEDFEEYNEALADWRTEMSEWPSDFIDVSTTECK